MHNLESADPIDLFRQWLAEAERSEPNDANAAALATSTPDGSPSVRMVLVKRADERGFCFFTNGESRKGTQLHANPRAALCFHWKSLRRQVRVEGRVTAMPDADVDAVLPHPVAQQPDRRRRFAAEPAACQPRGTGSRASANLPRSIREKSPPALLARLLRAPGTDRVLDKRRQPPARPLLIYPRCRSMENNPAVPISKSPLVRAQVVDPERRLQALNAPLPIQCP